MATYQSLGWPDVDPELLKGLPPFALEQRAPL